MDGWNPPLRVDETGGGCRLSLVGVAHGHGATLQDAADDLIGRLLGLLAAMRRSGFRAVGELGPPDPRVFGFIWELGELAARGEDIRARVFDPGA